MNLFPHQDGSFQLQAGLVAWGEYGLLISGPPRVGKTSLALAIMAKGGKITSDDYACLTLEAAGIYGTCLPQARYRLMKDAGIIQTIPLANWQDKIRLTHHIRLEQTEGAEIKTTSPFCLGIHTIPTLTFYGFDRELLTKLGLGLRSGFSVAQG